MQKIFRKARNMDNIMIKRGDVYYANLDPVIGHETGKTRPVVVIQNNIGNMYSPTTIIAIVTEYSEKKRLTRSALSSKKEEG
jgi:mRNA interferase MazF